jgi:hypothetical protein
MLVPLCLSFYALLVCFLVAQSCFVGGREPGTCAVFRMKISLSHSLEVHGELRQLSAV